MKEWDRLRLKCFLLGAALEVIQYLLRFWVASRLGPQAACWVNAIAAVIALIGIGLILLAAIGGLHGDIGK